MCQEIFLIFFNRTIREDPTVQRSFHDIINLRAWACANKYILSFVPSFGVDRHVSVIADLSSGVLMQMA